MTAVHPDASRQAVVEAALVLLERMGLTPADLAAVPQHRPKVPTFAEYIPVVSAAVSAGTRRADGSYWNRVVDQWGHRRLDEPTPSEIRQLMGYVKTHVVARRNARGGRSAEEHLVAALRCLYKRGGALHVTVLVDAAHTGRLARAGLGVTVHDPAQVVAEQIAGIPDVTYVLTGTGRFDVIAAADTSSEASLLRTIEQIRALRGVNRVQSWRHLQIVKESYPRMTPLDPR